MFEINNLIQGWRQITFNVHPLTVTGQSEACCEPDKQTAVYNTNSA